MTSIHVTTQDLLKTFKTRDNQTVTAVDHISLSVPQGQFLAIMGPSGSGKTTLLHLLAGLAKPDSGTVTVKDTELTSLGDKQLTLFRRRNIGVVFQAFNLIPTLTAEENILLPALAGKDKSLNTDKLNRAMLELVEQLQIAPRRKQFPETLSGGEQQRVAIARALLMDTALDSHEGLLLADEPTGNLDSTNSNEICKLLRKLCDEKKHTIIVVTHEHAVATWADRIITIRDGKIEQDETNENRQDANHND